MLNNAGIDLLYATFMSTSAQPAAANYMAVTANSGAPAQTNTTLTGEISGNGFSRKQATYAHTAASGTGGSHTATLTATFTATGSFASFTVAKIGIFNASSSGTMAFETQLTAGATISNAGDSLTITHTVTGVHS